MSGCLPYKAAVFDMDGTLLDSAWVWNEVDHRFFASRNLLPPADYTQAIGALSFRETAEYTIARFGLQQSPESLMDEWFAQSHEHYAHNVHLRPGAKAALQALHAKGVQLATATNLTTQTMLAVLKSNGVLGLFAALCSADEVPRGKAHPDLYHLAAQKLGVAPELCVAFDDTPKAMRGIRAAGMRACAVRYDAEPQDWAALCALSDEQVETWEQFLAQIDPLTL